MLFRRKIICVSWLDASDPRGLCLALRVRNAELVAAGVRWRGGKDAPHPARPPCGGSCLVPPCHRSRFCLDPGAACLEQSCCLGGEGRASLEGRKASKNAREQPRITFSGSLLGHVGRRAQGRRVIRQRSTVRWCLPGDGGGERLPRPGIVAGHPVLGVAATSSFRASGKSFKFSLFEKKENTFLSHTSLVEFPPAKRSRSLKRGGTTDTRLLREDAAAASSQTTRRNTWHVLSVRPSAGARWVSPMSLGSPHGL